jgi:DNA-binding helix-hairpin-helix protein with protein kinase domain
MDKKYFKQDRSPVSLATELGAGGEGTILTIDGEPDCVAKIYHTPPPPDKRNKILAMIQNPPKDPAIDGPFKFHSIVWPKDALYSDRRCVTLAGFTMPRIQKKGFKIIVSYILPEKRFESFSGAFTWQHLMNTAVNLASCVAAIHEKGHCVGDLNESNFMVAPDTLLAVIDCDSFQIKDQQTGRLWRCPVGRPEYAAPEICNADFINVDRTVHTDNFALAIMIFQLLMEGTHPYSAKGRLVEDAPAISDKIAKGIFPYVARKGIQPPVYAPPFKILDPDLQQLFIRCFESGHRKPQDRPSAVQWKSALQSGLHDLKICAVNPNHYHGSHLQDCPWCERAASLGVDSFQNTAGGQTALAGVNSKGPTDENRKQYLLQLIQMAICDGSITPDEEAFIISQAKLLHVSTSTVNKIISEATRSATRAPQQNAPVQTSYTQASSQAKQYVHSSPVAVATTSAPAGRQSVGSAAFIIRRLANRALLFIIFCVVPVVFALERCSR